MSYKDNSTASNCTQDTRYQGLRKLMSIFDNINNEFSTLLNFFHCAVADI